ncbi:hypothetical protein AYO21_03562 [Fonsecaea monophora]|uniref:Uncharacterized protein n=1 Tax=Fonsecaea monophora TaxID=254056 RepID=A0A177FD62_9EURO|nr:hypothetical protein AYO21_03562 [Fonsecaea monophora]OAG42108.1 hypothetical protein AYO21_03562 [Fonsecaea monophora]
MGNFTLSSYAGVGQANLKNLSVSQTARIGNRLEISGQGTLQMVIARWCQAANRSFTVTGGWDSRTGVVIEELGAQIDKAFENVDLALKDAGGAGWSQVYRDSVELVATDTIQTITETGVKTQSGREIHADAIILANGLKTEQILHRLEVCGQGEISLNEYWKRHCASYGSYVSSFPNFFIMMGPNSATGHISVVFSTECQINFTLHLLRPVLKEGAVATAISVVPNAEKRDNA